MSTIDTVLSARIFAALRTSAVANAAGVAAGTWSDTTIPHVFKGSGPYIGGRNRGRLPFIEFWIESQPFAAEHFQGGTVITTVRIVAHVGGRDLETANDLADAMLAFGIAAIRSEAVDNYTAMGDDQIAALEAGPWGHMRQATMTFEHTFDRTIYEAQ